MTAATSCPPCRPYACDISPMLVQRSIASAPCSGSHSQPVDPPPAPFIPPRITVVTRMSESSEALRAKTTPKASSAAFVATYMDSMGKGCNVDSLDVLMMSPPPAARSSGMAAVARVDGSGKVGRYLLVYVEVTEELDPARSVDGGIVDEDIDLAKAIADLGERFTHAGRIAHIRY